MGRIFENKRLALFLSICFKTLKNDPIPKRVAALMKRLLQVSLYQKPTFVCGALLVFSEALKLKPELYVLLKEPEPLRKIKNIPTKKENKKIEKRGEDSEQFEEEEEDYQFDEIDQSISDMDDDKKWEDDVDSSSSDVVPEKINIEDKKMSKKTK